MSFLLNSPYITYILGAFLIITVILLIFSVYLILYVIREYKKLEQMIDSAIDGNFRKKALMSRDYQGCRIKCINLYPPAFLAERRWRKTRENRRADQQHFPSDKNADYNHQAVFRPVGGM